MSYGQWSDLIDKFIEKNSQINLSAIRNEDEIFIKHIQDSLKLNEVFDIKGKSVVDIGTGSGFPLLPLAMTTPESQFIGIESIRKKVGAVNEIIDHLGVKNSKVIWSRAENHKGKYDILTARAVGYFDKLMEFGYNLVKPNGYFLLYKMYSEQEYVDILKICHKYKLALEKQYKYTLFEGDIERVIYIIKKTP